MTMRQNGIMAGARLVCAAALCAVLASLVGCVHTGDARRYCAAPSSLPGTERSMQTAGFWIGRHPAPDAVILDATGIAALNGTIRDRQKLTRDLLAIGPIVSGSDLGGECDAALERIRKARLYRADGAPAGRSFIRTVRARMGHAAFPAEITVTYGFVVSCADQRLVPTDDGLYAKPGDRDFDELQNSSFDAGTPLAIFAASTDGAWLFAAAPTSAGWIRREKVVRCTRAELERYLARPDVVVVTAPKADIFLDSALTRHYDALRMGASLRAAGVVDAAGAIQAILPAAAADGSFSERTVYLRADETHRGYLPYTPRTMITQAFRMLNAPYGWGGARGEQDCSSFLQGLFATVGIMLPRNSGAQAEVGRALAGFDAALPQDAKEKALVSQATGGITLLRMKGHIMLYLGAIDGRAYAIHDTWGYREGGTLRDQVLLVNRVAVTDLHLGAGSRKGSLLARLLSVRTIEQQ